MNEKFKSVGMKPADILLPKDCDMTRWAVVACDQFTSQPEYWEEVDRIAGDAPSTLRLILPESKLNDSDVDEHITNINRAMDDYLARDIFQTYPDSIIYIERTQSDGEVRPGLVAAVDLEKYDYTPGSGSLIRATEGTVLERIPPRVRVRKDAPIELPHVMLLIDDPKKTCIEPIRAAAGSMEKVYDFELMMKGGHLRGWKLSQDQMEALAGALANLASDDAMREKYGVSGVPPLVFAVGDGNHSLATAKTCYENLKKVTPQDQWDPPPGTARAWATPSPTPGPAAPAISTSPIPGFSWPWAPSRTSWTLTSRRTAARWTISTATRSRTSWAQSRAISASSSPPWARTSCSKPSSPMACCPARPSPWAMRRTSATMWRDGRSSNHSFFLKEKRIKKEL